MVEGRSVSRSVFLRSSFTTNKHAAMPNAFEGASYDKALKNIAPGKLIRTDMFKWIIERLRTLDERVREDGGDVVVPRVFGKTLGQALTILNQSSVNLQVGRVLDAEGRTYESPWSDVLRRTVINQVPQPGARTDEGQQVGLVLTAPVRDSDPGDGDEPASGPIEAAYQSSPGGLNVAIDSDAKFVHRFTVRNKTDQSLTIQLNPSIIGVNVDWSDAVEVRDPEDGSSITSVRLGSAEEKIVDVVVESPAELGADHLGETVTLRLNVNVGPPHDKSDADGIELTIAEEGGPAVTRSVKIEDLRKPNIADAEADATIRFPTDLRYTDEENTGDVEFTFTLEVANPKNSDVEDWTGVFEGFDWTSNPSEGIYAKPITLTVGELADITPRLQTPTRHATETREVDVSFRIEGTVQGESLSDSRGPFTVVVQSAG